MSTQSNTCRLCFEVCKAYKSLYCDNGTGNLLQEMTRKYFHPEIVDLDKAKMFTVICLECHQHIIDFNTFEAKIIVSQLKLLEDQKDVDLKVERNLCDLKSTIEKLSTESTDQIVIQDYEDVVEFGGIYSNKHANAKGYNATEPPDMAGPINNPTNIMVELKFQEIPSRNSTKVVINGSKDLNDDNQTSAKKEPEYANSASLIFPGNKQCNICHRTFIWGQSLSRHVRKHHAANCSYDLNDDNQTSAKKEPEYANSATLIFPGNKQCNICQRTFIWGQSLSRHVRKHHAADCNHDQSFMECRARNVKDETIQLVESQDEIPIVRIIITSDFENNPDDGYGIAAEVANPSEGLRITINCAGTEEHKNTHMDNTYDRPKNNSTSNTDASNNAGRLMEEQNERIDDRIIIAQITSAVTEDAEPSSTTQQIEAKKITKDLSEAKLLLDYNKTEPKTLNIRANHPTIEHYKDTSTVEVASSSNHIDTKTHEPIQTNVSIRPNDSCVIDLAQSQEEEFLQISEDDNIPTNMAQTVTGAEESIHRSGAAKALYDTIEREINEIIVLDKSLEEEFLQISEDNNNPTKLAPTGTGAEESSHHSIGASKAFDDPTKREISQIIVLEQSLKEEFVKISEDNNNPTKLAPTGTGAEESSHPIKLEIIVLDQSHEKELVEISEEDNVPTNMAPMGTGAEETTHEIIVLEQSLEEELVEISEDNNNPTKLAPTATGAEESTPSSGASKAINDPIKLEIIVLDQSHEKELVEVSEDDNVPTNMAPTRTGAEETNHESSAPMAVNDPIKRERIEIIDLEQSLDEELVGVSEDDITPTNIAPTVTGAEECIHSSGAAKALHDTIDREISEIIVLEQSLEEELVGVSEDDNVPTNLAPTGTAAEGNTRAGGAPKTFRDSINSKSNKGAIEISRNRKKCKFCRKQYFGPRGQYKHMKYIHRLVFIKKNISPGTNPGKTVSTDAIGSEISSISLPCGPSKTRQPLYYVTIAMSSQRIVHNKGISADEQASSSKLTGNSVKNSTRFKCKYCDRTYAWPQGLDKHMNKEHRHKSDNQRLKNSDLSYTAGTSVSSESREKLAKSHCAAVQKNTNFNKTNPGDLDVGENDSTKSKDNTKDNSKNFSCIFCSKRYTSAKTLRAHMKNCHSGKSNEAAQTTSTSQKILKPSASKIIQCKWCPKTYRQKSSAIQHMEICHLAEYRKSCKFACNICEKAYQSEYGFSVHMKTKHWDVLHQAKFIYNADKRIYQCLLCDQSFQYAGHMNGHINQKHLNDPKANFKCHKCKERSPPKPVCIVI